MQHYQDTMVSFEYWAPSMALTMKYLPTFDLSRFPAAHDSMHFMLLVLGYIIIFLYHTRHQVPIYQQKFHNRKMFLYIHIFTGMTEALRYRLREYLQGHSPILPDPVDVLSCFVWSWTSFELVKTLRRGDPRTTRPPYQAGALLRPIISLISYLFGVASLHKVSIGALDSFVYARLAIFFFSYTPYMRSARSSTVYAISIPLAPCSSLYHLSYVRFWVTIHSFICPLGHIGLIHSHPLLVS